MKERTSVLLAILFVPAVPASILVAKSVLDPIGMESSALALAVAFLLVYFYSLSAVLVIGLPAFLLLRYLGVARWWSALLAGGGIGILMAIVFPLRGRGSVSNLALDCIIGAASSLAFWFIWERGDRERKRVVH
jgi:hypothetical protein